MTGGPTHLRPAAAEDPTLLGTLYNSDPDASSTYGWFGSMGVIIRVDR